MRQKLALLLGALAGAFLVARLLRRRRPSRQVERSSGPPDPRADALRRQLAESRDGTDPSQAVATAEAPPDVDEARRRVHEHGRAAVDEMRRSAG